MSAELKDLISLVKHSNKPVREVVERYMSSVGWSMFKDEFDNRMTADEKEALFKKLESQRT